MFPKNSACNLASLNTGKFVSRKFGENTNFVDLDSVRLAARVMAVAQDILVGMSSYITPAIAENSAKYRPIGLGFTGLAGALMLMGIPYEDAQAVKITKTFAATITGSVYLASAEMAEVLGPFHNWDDNAASCMKVMNLHRDACDLKSPERRLWDEVVKCSKFRNAQATVVAPTGTISFMMDCFSAGTGIEPCYSLLVEKHLSSGGKIDMVCSTFLQSLSNLGYSDGEVSKISEYLLTNKTLKGSGVKPEHLPIFGCAVGDHEIPLDAHLGMMAAVQQVISGAISKTVNLPNSATRDDVSRTFHRAYEMGLKSITVYRYGCKVCQPLTAKVATAPVIEPTEKVVLIPEGWGSQKKPRSRRRGTTWAITVGGTKMYLTSGEYDDGSLCELFMTLGYSEGSSYRSIMSQFAALVSIALQHGTPLKKLIEKFANANFEPHGVVIGHPRLKSAPSLLAAAFRIISEAYLGMDDYMQIKYSDLARGAEYDISPKGTACSAESIPSNPSPSEPVPVGKRLARTTGGMCWHCGSVNLQPTGTCSTCLVCGASQGCS